MSHRARRGPKRLRGAAVIECDDVTRDLWAYLDGELPAPVAAATRDHIRGCERCRPFVRFERAFLRTLRAALASRAGPW